MKIRPARKEDIPAVTAIYDAIHTEEEQGRMVIGWARGVYPVRKTAEDSLADGSLYVMEDEGAIVASARINRDEVPEYAMIPWEYPAEKVLVLHTLTVDPARRGKGYGPAFARFYEQLARQLGISELRIDTNERNAAARRMYAKLQWQERGVIPCVFNGIDGVRLVCLEKHLPAEEEACRQAGAAIDKSPRE